MNVDFSTLYSLVQTGKRGSFSAECLVPGSATDVTGYLERLFQGGEIATMPVPFRWAEGSRQYDLLLSTIPSYLFSERAFDVLRHIGATGWRCYPIELRGKEGKSIEGFSGLVVTGRCGSLEYDRSHIETRIGVRGQPYKVKIGLFFDENSWDGSDIFAPKGTRFVFVTAKVKEALEAAKITNVTFTPLQTFERMW